VFAVFSRYARFAYIARLYLISLAIFSFAFAFPATLMNFYLEALGFDRAYIGVFHASSQFGGLVLALPALVFFERIGRRAALVFGAAFSIAMRLPTVLTTSPELILIAEALSGFGTVIFGLASVSLLADASTEDHRTALYGSSDFVRTIAILLGSMTAGSLPALIAPWLHVGEESAQAYQVVLVASFIVRMIGVFPLIMIARQRPANGEPTAALPEVRALRYLNPRVLLNQRPQVYALAAPFMLLLIAEALVFTFFNLLMRDWFGAGDALIGVVIGLNALIGAVAALLAPRVAAWLGYRPTIVWGSFATAVSIAAFALSPNLLVGILVVFIQVAVSQVVRVLYRVYVVNVSPREDYFIVSAVMAIAANVGPAVAPPISGFVQRSLGYTPLFVASVALTMLAAGLFAIFTRRTHWHPRDEQSAPVHPPASIQRPSPQTPLE
jgi:MFS family permease